MLAQFSKDDGATRGPELVLREEYEVDSFGDQDLGWARPFPARPARPDWDSEVGDAARLRTSGAALLHSRGATRPSVPDVEGINDVGGDGGSAAPDRGTGRDQ
jgi:hypothetical protein